MLYEFTVQSSRREEFILITDEINHALAAAGVKNGSCTVFIPHTTAAVTANECADADVQADLLAFLARLAPVSGAYRHREGNSDAHIKAALLGTSLHLLVREGKLDLGTWQGFSGRV